MLRFAFSHHPRPSGSYNSICNRCSATVTSSHNEADLEAAEKTHKCDKVTVGRHPEDGTRGATLKMAGRVIA
jgi:hypothetical protein